MKHKLLLSYALLLGAFVTNAVPWSEKTADQATTLIKDEKFIEARELLNSIDEDQQRSIIYYRIWLDYADPTIDTSTPARLRLIAEKHCKVLGVTGQTLDDTTEYAIMLLLSSTDSDEELIAYFKTLKNPSKRSFRIIIDTLKKLKRDNEVRYLTAAMNKYWYEAFRYAQLAKNQRRSFEYAKKAIMHEELSPSKLIKALKVIDTTDSTVPGASRIEKYLFLKRMRLRYDSFFSKSSLWNKAKKEFESTLKKFE